MTASPIDVSQDPMPRDTRPRVFLRLGLGVLGWALLFSSFGLWAVPGSENAPELSLMKLGLSVFILIAGLCCIVSARPPQD